MSAESTWNDILGQHNVPTPAPTVENTECWARPGTIAVIKFDQLDNETSIINSKTLRLLLARGNYQFISAHQKKDTE